MNMEPEREPLIDYHPVRKDSFAVVFRIVGSCVQTAGKFGGRIASR